MYLSEPLVESGWSTIAQMKGNYVPDKNICSNKFRVYVGGRYLKKTSHLLTKIAKSLSNGSVLSHSVSRKGILWLK